MKKLLSLLSVLTISGTSVPITIAASLYQKEEIIKRNKIENNNKLENYYCFLCPNRLVAKISHENWKKIYLNFKDKISIKDKYNYIYSIINNFEKRNSSGDLLSRDNFLNSDVEIIATLIYDHFFEINDIFNRKINDNMGLYIKTNRDKYWEKYDNPKNDFYWGAYVNFNEKKLDEMNEKNGKNTLIVGGFLIKIVERVIDVII